VTYISNSPESFASEALAGFVSAAYPYVRAVPGGVVRAQAPSAGKVAIVIGGGTGHYPAFAGYVGEGMADGAVCGDIFSSPSTRQVVDVCRAAESGAGVWLAFGNYAGDVLNFTAAAGRLRTQGIGVELLAVSDDVASAPPEDAHSRRGVAGDVTVVKIAGAAAAQGRPLDEVGQIGRIANARTRSFGVAFDGCTLPGAAEPLFTLPDGAMGLGLGIHGEPGVGEESAGSADDLADRLVDRVLAEWPSDAGDRAAVLLNGLGTIKYEELFVLWKAVAARLTVRGVRIVAPQVGEHVTSLDMAGCSLTVTWLDRDLEELWLAPADTPAFHRTAVWMSAVDPGPGRVGDGGAETHLDTSGERPASEVLEASRMGSGLVTAHGDMPDAASTAPALGTNTDSAVLAALEVAAAVLHEHAQELGRLDAVAGDGDHGRGMCRGIDAALGAARGANRSARGESGVLADAAEAWADRAGGTSGALWGVGLTALAGYLPTDAQPITLDAAARGAQEAARQIAAAGGAEVGDKTLLDALVPFADTLTEAADAGMTARDAIVQACRAADLSAEGTAAIPARRGRARVLADKSVGTPDPGATSLAFVLSAIAALVSETDR
jgi:dihydroxyacetone kinase